MHLSIAPKTLEQRLIILKLDLRTPHSTRGTQTQPTPLGVRLQRQPFGQRPLQLLDRILQPARFHNHLQRQRFQRQRYVIDLLRGVGHQCAGGYYAVFFQPFLPNSSAGGEGGSGGRGREGGGRVHQCERIPRPPVRDPTRPRDPEHLLVERRALRPARLPLLALALGTKDLQTLQQRGEGDAEARAGAFAWGRREGVAAEEVFVDEDVAWGECVCV